MLSAFPEARSTKIGRTIWYNRQRSVQYVICDGFGRSPSADFPVTGDMVCGLVTAAVGGVTKGLANHLALFASGTCSAPSLAAHPTEPERYESVACGWVSSLLEVLAKPAGILANVGCTFAPSTGHSIGAIFESKHELDVADDIIGRGKCLKYSPSHFGSPWLAIECGRKDQGFNGLPQSNESIVNCGTVGSSAGAGYTRIRAWGVSCSVARGVLSPNTLPAVGWRIIHRPAYDVFIDGKAWITGIPLGD